MAYPCTATHMTYNCIFHSITVVKPLESRIDDIMIWIFRNNLKRNDSKTEKMVLYSPLVNFPALSIAVGAESHQ